MTALVALLLAASCPECHRDVARRFEASRHARAFELPVFALPFRQAHTGWCLGCHRPEGRGTAGLGCLSCHGVEGDASAVRGSGRSAGRPISARAHRVVADATFETDACGRCHEFDAPDSGEPLQTTMSETAGRACSSCHDPHSARGAHDLPTLKSGVRFDAYATAEGVEVRVTGGAGHRFPSGDPFRRLVVEVCDEPECRTPLDRRVLSKSFGLVGSEWKKLRDGSLGDGDAAVLEFPAGRFWRATYFYGDPRFETELEADEVFVEVGKGAVTPRRP